MSAPHSRDADQAVNEITGDAGPADIEQQHADPMDHPPVRVAQDGPVMVEVLPADGPCGTGRVSLDAANQPFARIVNADGRRCRVQLVCIGQSFRVGVTQQEAVNGAIWPANEPLVMSTTSELWVARDTNDATVSYVFESWTR